VAGGSVGCPVGKLWPLVRWHSVLAITCNKVGMVKLSVLDCTICSMYASTLVGFEELKLFE